MRRSAASLFVLSANAAAYLLVPMQEDEKIRDLERKYEGRFQD